MARPGITYKQVADAADAMHQAGNHPTINAIREALGGTGSPNTIHKHLTAWKEGAAPPVTKTAEFPARLIQALQDELSKATNAAREEVQLELFAARAEAIELAKAGEAIEAERDNLAETVERLVKERDVYEAVEEKTNAEIKKLAQEVKAQQLAAEDARTELAKAKLTIGTLLEKKQELTTENAGLRKELTLTIQERQKAWQESAVMQAKLDAAERRASEAAEREKATTAKLERSEDEMRLERIELTKSRTQIETQQEAIDKAVKPKKAPSQKINARQLVAATDHLEAITGAGSRAGEAGPAGAESAR